MDDDEDDDEGAVAVAVVDDDNVDDDALGPGDAVEVKLLDDVDADALKTYQHRYVNVKDGERWRQRGD